MRYDAVRALLFTVDLGANENANVNSINVEVEDCDAQGWIVVLWWWLSREIRIDLEVVGEVEKKKGDEMGCDAMRRDDGWEVERAARGCDVTRLWDYYFGVDQIL